MESPRSVDMTQEYAFTVTLSKKLHHVINTDQLDVTRDSLKRMIENMTSKEDYCLIAELTQAHDIHYHGIIRFKLKRYRCPINAFYNEFKKNPKFGFVNIKPIHDYNKWKEYISKDFTSFKYKMGRTPIIHNGNDTFTFFEHEAC